MNNSKEFNLMLDRAIEYDSEAFKGFDRTKNVQDQLQRMLHTLESPLEVSMAFGDWCRQLYLTDVSWIVASMEQLWLTFIMSERYQKI